MKFSHQNFESHIVATYAPTHPHLLTYVLILCSNVKTSDEQVNWMNVYFPIKNFDANTKLFFGCIQLNVHSFGFSGKSGVKFGVSCNLN